MQVAITLLVRPRPRAKGPSHLLEGLTHKNIPEARTMARERFNDLTILNVEK